MPQKKKSNRKLSVGYTEKSHKNDKVMTRSQGINRRTSFQQDDSDRRHRRYKLIRKPLYMFTNLTTKLRLLSTLNPCEAVMRMSAGIRSPNFTSMTSPTTSSSARILTFSPPRTAIAYCNNILTSVESNLAKGRITAAYQPLHSQYNLQWAKHRLTFSFNHNCQTADVLNYMSIRQHVDLAIKVNKHHNTTF